MFHGNSAHELGYANSAVLVVLLRALVKEKILTERMAEDVVRDGIKILTPAASNHSVASAMKFLQTAFSDAFWKSQHNAA